MTTPLRILGIDEGRQELHCLTTGIENPDWTLDLKDLPLARDMQLLEPSRALIGFDRGLFEIDPRNGEVLLVREGWKTVTSVQRKPDGTTRVAGINLEGREGVVILTLDENYQLIGTQSRPGPYVRLVRDTPEGTLLLCTDDHILETDGDLNEIRRFSAPGFRHAWKPHRFADGTTLVSAGYGAFMALFGKDGSLLKSFGAKGQVPEGVDPFFYATFQLLPDGSILVANWQDHGPQNGSRGRQLLRFTPGGDLSDSWSWPNHVSSLQGILVI